MSINFETGICNLCYQRLCNCDCNEPYEITRREYKDIITRLEKLEEKNRK